jgi:hypothetical protein
MDGFGRHTPRSPTGTQGFAHSPPDPASRDVSEPSGRFQARTGKEEPAMTNEGTVDRVVRVAIGVALLSITMVGPQTPWGYVGLVPLATGLFGFCPLYRLVGISTCKVPAK